MTLAHVEGIQVARELGFRFIWIDALCIIQGRDKASRDDWMRESVRIPQVYGNATLTIVAGSSSDSRRGFLNCTERSNTRYARVKCNLPGGGSEMCYIALERSQDVGPTDARAWCFQESILSRRMLVFGKQQLSFRCREQVEYEDGNWRLLSDKTELYDYTIPKDWTLRAVVFRCWYDITMQYSMRDFFDPHDNFAAISGIAQQFQTALRDSDNMPRYLAGMWETDMIRGLLWRSRRLVDENEKALSRPISVNGAETGRVVKTAPSWSWLSLKGSITQGFGSSYNLIMLDPTAYRCFPKIHNRWAAGDWDPTLIKHEDMQLPFKLEVRGSLKRVRVSSVPVSQYPFPIKWKDDYGIKPVPKHAVLLESCEILPLREANMTNWNTVVATGLFDLENGNPTTLWSMLLTNEEGLLLQRTNEGYYERVGVFKQQWGYDKNAKVEGVILI
jgi:hypothetical protein